MEKEAKSSEERKEEDAKERGTDGQRFSDRLRTEVNRRFGAPSPNTEDSDTRQPKSGKGV